MLSAILVFANWLKLIDNKNFDARSNKLTEHQHQKKLEKLMQIVHVTCD